MRWKTGAVAVCGLALAVCACKLAALKPGQFAVGEDVVARNFLQLPKAEAVASEHFVRRWLVLGPFPFETGKHGGDEDQGAARIEFVKDEAGLIPKEGVEIGGKKWIRYKSAETEPEFINLDSVFGTLDYAGAYIGCYVYAPRPLNNLILKTGSDDYETVWINGKKVYTYDQRRRAPKPDQDSIRGVSLKKGKNVLVVKVVDVVKRWGFYGRFTDENGNPMRVTDKP